MRLAVVLVHYRTPELAVAAVEALRADLAGSGLEAEWRLVDNGSDAAGRELLAGLPVERIDPGRNLGFAGGVNLGVARSSAEAILLMNPDVLVLPGCVRALVGALADGAAAAGPRFYWDRGRRLLLPPPELRTRREEVAGLLARRGGGWEARARRRWRRHARRHWTAERPLPSYSLSGSLLALRRSAWQAVGPFDESFALYFEETEWLARLERRGLPALYLPRAEAVHLHGQSAVQEPRARGWFEDSARRFRRLRYGAWFPPLLAAAERLLPPVSVPEASAAAPAAGLPLAELPGRRPLWVEVSPNASGYPAASEPVREDSLWSLPGEVAERLPRESLTLQVADAEGREVGRYRLPAVPGTSS